MASKKILVLGSGMVARPCVEYLLRDPQNEVTVGQRVYLAIPIPIPIATNKNRFEQAAEHSRLLKPSYPDSPAQRPSVSTFAQLKILTRKLLPTIS